MLTTSPVTVTMPAVDLARARKFYTETLGLKALEAFDGILWLEAGNGTQIVLYPREATQAEHTAATFNVSNLDEVVDGLIAKGVVFEQYDFDKIKTDARGVAVDGENKMAWFKDTEGNILGLVAM
jgi:catechol 2,3-dioxygenase-like lactoylglutathione lyase family enzyme